MKNKRVVVMSLFSAILFSSCNSNVVPKEHLVTLPHLETNEGEIVYECDVQAAAADGDISNLKTIIDTHYFDNETTKAYQTLYNAVTNTGAVTDNELKEALKTVKATIGGLSGNTEIMKSIQNITASFGVKSGIDNTGISPNARDIDDPAEVAKIKDEIKAAGDRVKEIDEELKDPSLSADEKSKLEAEKAEKKAFIKDRYDLYKKTPEGKDNLERKSLDEILEKGSGTEGSNSVNNPNGSTGGGGGSGSGGGSEGGGATTAKPTDDTTPNPTNTTKPTDDTTPQPADTTITKEGETSNPPADTTTTKTDDTTKPADDTTPQPADITTADNTTQPPADTPTTNDSKAQDSNAQPTDPNDATSADTTKTPTDTGDTPTGNGDNPTDTTQPTADDMYKDVKPAENVLTTNSDGTPYTTSQLRNSQQFWEGTAKTTQQQIDAIEDKWKNVDPNEDPMAQMGMDEYIQYKRDMETKADLEAQRDDALSKALAYKQLADKKEKEEEEKKPKEEEKPEEGKGPGGENDAAWDEVKYDHPQTPLRLDPKMPDTIVVGVPIVTEGELELLIKDLLKHTVQSLNFIGVEFYTLNTIGFTGSLDGGYLSEDMIENVYTVYNTVCSEVGYHAYILLDYNYNVYWDIYNSQVRMISFNNYDEKPSVVIGDMALTVVASDLFYTVNFDDLHSSMHATWGGTDGLYLWYNTMFADGKLPSWETPNGSTTTAVSDDLSKLEGIERTLSKIKKTGVH